MTLSQSASEVWVPDAAAEEAAFAAVFPDHPGAGVKNPAGKRDTQVAVARNASLGIATLVREHITRFPEDARSRLGESLQP